MCSQLTGSSEQTLNRMEHSPCLVIWLYSHMIGACLFLFSVYYRNRGDNSRNVRTQTELSLPAPFKGTSNSSVAVGDRLMNNVWLESDIFWGVTPCGPIEVYCKAACFLLVSTLPYSSIPGRGKRFFSIPQRPDRLWDPPSLLPNGYRGKAAGPCNWPLTSIRLHGLVLN
jgi:hypothetical protein